MSTIQPPQSDRSGDNTDSPSAPDADETCGQCGTPMDSEKAIHGAFCSWECLYRHRGEGILEQIRSDHTICSTCYGKVKDIEPIGDKYDFADGYQYSTENAYIGAQDEFYHEDLQGNQHRASRTRWGCQCGNVDLRDTHADIQNAELKTVLSNCLQTLYHLHQKGAIPFAPSREAYFDALREHWRDAAYAIGKAVYADTPE